MININEEMESLTANIDYTNDSISDYCHYHGRWKKQKVCNLKKNV